MNFEGKRQKAANLIQIAKDRGYFYEAKETQHILDKVDIAAKVDVRHANGILDRLLKSEFCIHLIEEENNKNEE